MRPFTFFAGTALAFAQTQIKPIAEKLDRNFLNSPIMYSWFLALTLWIRTSLIFTADINYVFNTTNPDGT